jgi:thiopeptide-type bacteriocin biosynthesis protein
LRYAALNSVAYHFRVPLPPCNFTLTYMSWLSFHFVPAETPDVFLARAVYPFVEQQIWQKTGYRFFFVRHPDSEGQPELRLRFKGDLAAIRAAFVDHFQHRGTWTEVAYQAEIERYGGPDQMALAEEHFHISSRVVLDRLRRPNHTYADVLHDALRMHTMTLAAAGLSAPESADYFDRLCDAWIPAFFRPADGITLDNTELIADVKADFEATLAPQFDKIYEQIRALWVSLVDNQHDFTQPEWLRWWRGNEIIMKSLDSEHGSALASLIHMTNNRLGLNNADEAYIIYVLGQMNVKR